MCGERDERECEEARHEEDDDAVEKSPDDVLEHILFLLVAITYVNTLEERRVFDVLRAKLTARGFSYKQLFWITGALAFALSPVLDNLTTALILGAVVMAVGAGSPKFIAIAFAAKCAVKLQK